METAMPHPVDAHVGSVIRTTRWKRRMTQQQLAEKIGVRFQQVQKYETGSNRVSASRLWEIASVLEVPLAHFFETYGSQAPATEPDRDALVVMASYQRLSNHQKESIRRLLDAMVQAVD